MDALGKTGSPLCGSNVKHEINSFSCRNVTIFRIFVASIHFKMLEFCVFFQIKLKKIYRSFTWLSGRPSSMTKMRRFSRRSPLLEAKTSDMSDFRAKQAKAWLTGYICACIMSLGSSRMQQSSMTKMLKSRPQNINPLLHGDSPELLVPWGHPSITLQSSFLPSLSILSLSFLTCSRENSHCWGNAYTQALPA